MIGERRRGLVHDEQSCPRRECPRDLDELLLRQAEVGDRHTGVDVEINLREQISRGRAHRSALEPTGASRHPPHEEILGDAERREHRQLLVNDGDPRRLRLRGRVEVDFSSREHDPPRVAPHGTGQDVDQRALAGAVLTYERVNLTGADAERHAAQSKHPAEALVHARHLEQERPAGRVRHALDIGRRCHERGARNCAALTLVITSARVRSRP